MRILQVAHSLPFMNQAGTELYTYSLSLELSKRHQVYIFARSCDTREKEYAIKEDKISGVTAYLLNNTFRYCESFSMFYQNSEIDNRFRELLDKLAPDIVHIQHLVFLSIGLIKQISDRGIPIIFTLHDYWLMCPRWHILKDNSEPCEKAFSGDFDQECVPCLNEMLSIKKGVKKIYHILNKIAPAFILQWLKDTYFFYCRKVSDTKESLDKLKEMNDTMKGAIRKVSLFLTPSEYVKSKFVQFGIPGEKIKFLRYGLDRSIAADTEKIKDKKIRFGFIGTMLPAKGLHILIDAFNRISPHKAELRIYGKLYGYIGFEYYLPRLKKIIKNKNIKLMGKFIHPEISAIFKEIDIIVVPSIWRENSPLVIQEAFLFNTPVVASRIGGISELIKDGINGLLFSPGDAGDLQEKMQHIIDNPDLIERFKKNMPKVKSIEENAKEIEELYASLVYKKGQHAAQI